MLGLSLPAIIKTVSMVGAQAPAFIELFQQVKGAFSEEDQQKLQSAGITTTEKELGVDNTWMITCRDPNGVYIELHQYTEHSLQHRGGTCHIDYHP